MVVGAAAALLRKVPGQLWTFFQQRLSITVEVPDRDPAFRWLQVWLANQPYAGRARDLRVRDRSLKHQGSSIGECTITRTACGTGTLHR